MRNNEKIKKLNKTQSNTEHKKKAERKIKTAKR